MAAATKPRITVVSDSYARVSYRGLCGSLNASSPKSWEAIVWMDSDVHTTEVVGHYLWSGEQALKVLVRSLDLIADCRDLAVLVDRLEAAGLRTRVEQIGGPLAIASFDAALAHVQNVATFDAQISTNRSADRAAAAMLTINAMIKTASAKRAPKPVKVVAEYCGRRSYALTIIPGFSITFDADGRTYHVGELCETGSYNLTYFGRIERITAKTVTTRDDGSASAKRLWIEEFADRNHDDLGPKFAANAEEMQYI